MRTVLYLLFFIQIIGCDSSQRVSILVVDSNTGYAVDSVEIWKTSNPQNLRYTDKYGFLQLKGITGRFSRCSKVQLTFNKKEYKSLTKEFKLDLQDTIVVMLKKDFDFSELRQQILDSVVFIEKINRITSEFVGYGGRTPKQWYTRKWLITNTTESELISLIDYPNSVIKAIAFEGLCKIGYHDIYEILVKIVDLYNIELHYQSGCLRDVLYLGDYCFTNIAPYQLSDLAPRLPFYDAKSTLTTEQIITIKGKLGKYN